MERRRWIRASEIGEWSYCRRAWWLRHIAGWEPSGHDRLQRGVALHAAHGRRVRASHAMLLLALLLMVLALLFLLR